MPILPSSVNTTVGDVACRPAFDLFAELCRGYNLRAGRSICGVGGDQIEKAAFRAGNGANFNLVIGNGAIDPISGSVPHRAYLCQIRRAD